MSVKKLITGATLAASLVLASAASANDVVTPTGIAPEVTSASQMAGPLPGTVLTPTKGLTVTKDGTTLEGLLIEGCVRVRANAVTIRNSVIRCSSPGAWAVRTYPGFAGLLVEHAEIDGGGVTSTAVCCANYRLSHVEIHNTIDGARLGSNTVVEDSYIHSLSRQPGSHNDTLQTTGGRNITVRRNHLQPFDVRTGDRFNAGIMIGSTTSPSVEGMTIVDNYIDGGGYSINFRKDAVLEDVLVANNRFGGNCRSAAYSGKRKGLVFDATNSWAVSGAQVDDGSKHGKARGCRR